MPAMTGVLDDQALLRYRQLLDAEDAAFDDLEHASEDGDRSHYEEDMSAWLNALERKLAFLSHLGLELELQHTA